MPREWATLLKLRVPKHKTLPDVLTVDEVHRLLDAVRTPHNRAFLWTVYSLGLRLQEGLALELGDIDSARMLVHVHRGKGAKDRFIPLPARTLTTLREYWATHHHPRLVFPAIGRGRKDAPTATTPMAVASVQGAMRRVSSSSASGSRSTCTRSGTATRPICWKRASTCGSSSSTLAIVPSRRP